MGLFKKEKNFKFSVTIDGEVVYVNEKVWRHIRELVEKINELHEDNNMKKRELDSLKPIVETKEYKPAIGEECVDCKYAEEPTPKEHTIRRATMYNCFKQVLYPPKNFIPYNCDRTKYKTEVLVDTCLANEIEELWKKGIRTMGCCCGHGRHLGMIQVLPEDAKKMVALGYEFYIYPEDYNFSRADAFIPKSYGHDYSGYTDSYLG